MVQVDWSTQRKRTDEVTVWGQGPGLPVPRRRTAGPRWLVAQGIDRHKSAERSWEG